MGNKLKQYIPYAIISIPFVFWYLSVIVSGHTYYIKLFDFGIFSFAHIIVSVIFYVIKKLDS